jgi:hypothetical protein
MSDRELRCVLALVQRFGFVGPWLFLASLGKGVEALIGAVGAIAISGAVFHRYGQDCSEWFVWSDAPY